MGRKIFGKISPALFVFHYEGLTRRLFSKRNTTGFALDQFLSSIIPMYSLLSQRIVAQLALTKDNLACTHYIAGLFQYSYPSLHTLHIEQNIMNKSAHPDLAEWVFCY